MRNDTPHTEGRYDVTKHVRTQKAIRHLQSLGYTITNPPPGWAAPAPATSGSTHAVFQPGQVAPFVPNVPREVKAK
jgi:hypothetical protein